jgi:hypothetical protein
MKKILLFTAVIAMVFGGTALAADYSFYGNARMGMWSVNQDKDWSSNPFTNNDDFRSTAWFLHDNSRFGAKASAGDISGNVEFGWFEATDVNSSTSAAKQAARIRHLYGEWNFGSGSVLAGQTWAPSTFFLSNQVAAADQGFLTYGHPALRAPQITFKFGGFKIGLLSPSTGAATAGTYTIKQATLPKVELAYAGAMGPVKLHVAGGYNSINLVTATNNSISATSYMFNAMAKYAAGPFSVGGAFTYGINGSEYGDSSLTSVDAAGALVGTEYKDNTAWAGSLVVAFQVNDMVGLEGGYAYVVGKDDGAANDDTAQSFYFQVPLTLADGVVLTPEFTLFDKMENAAKTKQGSESHIGAKMQISF